LRFREAYLGDARTRSDLSYLAQSHGKACVFAGFVRGLFGGWLVGCGVWSKVGVGVGEMGGGEEDWRPEQLLYSEPAIVYPPPDANCPFKSSLRLFRPLISASFALTPPPPN
jgi:hypothetical protein